MIEFLFVLVLWASCTYMSWKDRKEGRERWS